MFDAPVILVDQDMYLLGGSYHGGPVSWKTS